jgi:hypothetical protein
MHKRWAVAAGSALAAVTVLGSAGMAFADLVITVPAPVGQATATAANVVGVLGVANTASAATPTSGAASADALKVGNTTVVGGSQIGVGTNSGKVIDTGSTPLGRLQVLPWNANVSQSSAGQQANSSAAAARATLINPNVANLDLLQSGTSASHSGMKSSGNAYSDLAVANVGGVKGMTIKVLHSESNSSGAGLTYVISFNDKPLISVDQLGAHLCALNLPSILNVSCLAVAGGLGNVSSQVLGLQIAGPKGLLANALQAAASGGAASVAPAAAAGPANVEAARTTRAAAGSNALARTGVAIGFALSLAVALLALGGVILAIRRQVMTPGAHAA